MESKKAIAILIKILGKYQLGLEEKEAISTAIGVLDCATLAENRIKGIIKAKKAKRDKSFEV